jgi:hypothetical protein
VWSAREVSLLEPEILEHALRERDVLRLAAMRRTAQRELVVAPLQHVEAARLEKRHHLKWLGARSPGAHQ